MTAAVSRTLPLTYIAHNETTPRNATLYKVAAFGVLLGAGLLFASLSVGTALIAISSFACKKLSEIDSSEALAQAVDRNNRTMVRFLLLLGANPNIKIENTRRFGAHAYQTPLSRAAAGSPPSIVKDLLEAGANPNTEDLYRQTPLTEAAYANAEENVALLLEYGADPRVRARHSVMTSQPAGTPLDYARLRGNPRMIGMLEAALNR